MKRIIVCVVGLVWTAFSQEVTSLWSQVEAALQKDLPKTAMESLTKIATKSVQEKQWDDALAALAQQAILTGQIEEGDKPYGPLVRLEEVRNRAPEALKPLVDALIAEWYWSYFSSNRWRFAQRTDVSEGDEGSDIDAWSLPRMLREVDSRFQRVLSKPDLLARYATATFKRSFREWNVADGYRPTVYDVIVSRALAFYLSPEAQLQEDVLAVQAAPALRGDEAAFGKWVDQTCGLTLTACGTSATRKALVLMRQVLAFNRMANNALAYADWDFERMLLAMKIEQASGVVGEELKKRSTEALKAFASRWANNEVCARALAYQAEMALGEENYAVAMQLAENGMNRFPRSSGARECRNVIVRVKQPSLTVTTPNIWAKSKPEVQPYGAVDLRARNVTNVWISLYAWRMPIEQNDKPFDVMRIRELVVEEPKYQWTQRMATTNYASAAVQFAVNDPVTVGAYVLVVSTAPSIELDASKTVCAQVIQVSDFAIEATTLNTTGERVVRVLHRETGLPIEGADVHVITRDNRNPQVSRKVGKTDLEGRCTTQLPASGYDTLVIMKGDDILVDAKGWESWRASSREHDVRQTLLLTDRAIYRPGQTVYYKGIYYFADSAKNEFGVRPTAEYTIRLLDPNFKTIEARKERANAFGSFAGSFVIPSGHGTGRMTLMMGDTVASSASFQVEEYKRPKFEVIVDPIKQAVALKSKVHVTGRATAYTGTAVDQAKVAWQVVRASAYPWWCWWRHAENTTIASGKGTTDEQGGFAFDFVAEPEAAARADDGAVFTYRIETTVVDSTGETRAGTQSLVAGFAGLSVSVTVPEWFEAKKEHTLSITTTTLNGEPLAQQGGEVVVVRLKQPARPAANEKAELVPWRTLTSREQALQWPDDKEILRLPFTTDARGEAKVACTLDAGCYRVDARVKTKEQRIVKGRALAAVFVPGETAYTVRLFGELTVQQRTVEVGQTFRALWGSGFPAAMGEIEIWADNKLVRRFTSQTNATQLMVAMDVPETLRGGFTVRSTQVREGRYWQEMVRIDVPWSNKKLGVSWSHLRSKLEPGAQEKWTVRVNDAEGKPVKAELLAVMYDASLDAFVPQEWPKFQGFRMESSWIPVSFSGRDEGLVTFTARRAPELWTRTYPEWASALIWARNGKGLARRLLFEKIVDAEVMPAAAPMMNTEVADAVSAGVAGLKAATAGGAGAAVAANSVPLVRRNLKETAFFMPRLVSDAEEGTAAVSFTVPEALTSWRVMVFAHDAALRSGFAEAKVVTQRKLMVEPNMPRFVRAGDVIELPIKVSNTDSEEAKGVATLKVVDARSGRAIDGVIQGEVEQAFALKSGANTKLGWRLCVPEALSGILQYTIEAHAAQGGDGEEGFLPVLSQRVLMRESVPLVIKPGAEKRATLPALLASKENTNVVSVSLVAEATPNMTWQAILALAPVMEQGEESVDALFQRYYATTLARQIIKENPSIATIIARWSAAGGEAFKSPLSKNENLAQIALAETPWLAEAEDENSQRRRLAQLLEGDRMAETCVRAVQQLKAARNSDGLWPWFPGGPKNIFVSLSIVSGLGHLRELGATTVDSDLINESVTALDGWMLACEQQAQANGQTNTSFSAMDALYVYGRSYFLKECRPSEEVRVQIQRLVERGRAHWTGLGRMSRAHFALACKRLGEFELARDILKSIREHAVVSEDLGMCWRDTEYAWFWFEQPLETQALMIESFLQIASDQESANACAQWLIMQKEVQRWPTCAATVDAVYALLLGKSVTSLAPQVADIEMRLGGESVQASDVEAGSGYFSVRATGRSVRPEMGDIVVTNFGHAVATAAVHWQYSAPIDALTGSSTNVPITIKRSLFVERVGPRKSVLHPLTNGVMQVGDTLVTRVQVRIDRDMEFVHLKDARGAVLEPMDVLSSYKWQDGVGYFQSTRDTATHFFFDRLPRGTYVFEYRSRAFQQGRCNSGFATIECLYAPRYRAYSASASIQVK